MARSPLPLVNIGRLKQGLVAEIVDGDAVPQRIDLRDDQRRHVAAQRRRIPDADRQPVRGTVPGNGLRRRRMADGSDTGKSGENDEHTGEHRVTAKLHRVQVEYREGSASASNPAAGSWLVRTLTARPASPPIEEGHSMERPVFFSPCGPAVLA